MRIAWDEAASMLQEWLDNESVLLARSTFTECPGNFKIIIVGVIAAEFSFVIGTRELADDGISAVRQLTIDLTGCTFSVGESPGSLLASRKTGEEVSFLVTE